MKNYMRTLCLYFALCLAASAFTVNTSTGTFNAASAVGDFSAFSWKWSDFDDQAIDVEFVGEWTNGNVSFSMAYPKYGDRYLTAYNSSLSYDGTNTSVDMTIPRTNVPPNQTYFAEFLFTHTNGQTRSLAKGKVTTQWSVYSVTNAADWVPVDISYSWPATSETDPIHTAWLTNASLSTLKLGGTTNVLTDDGTNLLRNGVLIAGSGTGSSFPLTNNVSAAGFNISSIGTAAGNTANFTTFTGANMSLSGNLNVSSNVTYNTVENYVTTIYLGTNYITNTAVTQVTTTNNVYLYTNVVYTETRYSTNYTTYETFFQNGGYFNATGVNWFATPHILDSNGTVTANGSWDFSSASVSGIDLGGATNIAAGGSDSYNESTRTLTWNTNAAGGAGSGFPLTENGDLAGFSLTNGFFVGDGSGLTNLSVATTETDPIFTNWNATTYASDTTAIWNAIGGLASTSGVILGVTITGGTATTNAGIITLTAPSSGGTSTKSIGGAATDWAWSDSDYIVSRTTGGVTFLEFPLDTTNKVNGVNLLGIDGIAVTQVIFKATAYTGGGTVGLLTGFDGSFVTNTITLAAYPTVTLQAVSISLPALTGTTNALFQWGVDSTNNIGTATGNAWFELFQARGTW